MSNEFEPEAEDIDADESTAPAVDRVYTPKEKVLRSLQACYPKVYEKAVEAKLWDKISGTTNPAGHLEVFAVKQIGVPTGERRETVKALKRILIRGNKSLLEAAEKSCLAEVLKKHQINIKPPGDIV